jgi:hypothetical protein
MSQDDQIDRVVADLASAAAAAHELGLGMVKDRDPDGCSVAEHVRCSSAGYRPGKSLGHDAAALLAYHIQDRGGAPLTLGGAFGFRKRSDPTISRFENVVGQTTKFFSHESPPVRGL